MTWLQSSVPSREDERWPVFEFKELPRVNASPLYPHYVNSRHVLWMRVLSWEVNRGTAGASYNRPVIRAKIRWWVRRGWSVNTEWYDLPGPLVSTYAAFNEKARELVKAMEAAKRLHGEAGADRSDGVLM